MKLARMKYRIMIRLIGGLLVTTALAGSPRPLISSTLPSDIGRQLAMRLAVATTPSHDPRHPATMLVSLSAALDRALGEYLARTPDVGRAFPR